MQEALFAVGFFVQAWYTDLKPKRRKAFIRRSRWLLARYREGKPGMDLRPEIPISSLIDRAWATTNWLERLIDCLDKLPQAD